MDSELSLMARLKTGDEHALAELYHLLSPKVFALALQMLGNREEAEEILQDCFFKLFQKAVSFDSELGSPRAFIFTIARNEALMRLRARRSRPKVAHEIDLHEQTHLLSQQPENIGDKVMVERLLDTLEQDEQMLLNHAYFRGYSHSEIASYTGQPLGTIKSKLRRALLKLRHHMEAS